MIIQDGVEDVRWTGTELGSCEREVCRDLILGGLGGELADDLLPNQMPVLEQEFLVIRPASLIPVHLQVSLELAVQVAFHDIAGDSCAHGKCPEIDMIG